MKYAVVLSKRAKRQIVALSQVLQERIILKIRDLELNPRPYSSKKMEGFKIFIGFESAIFRLFKIKDNILLIAIEK